MSFPAIMGVSLGGGAEGWWDRFVVVVSHCSAVHRALSDSSFALSFEGITHTSSLALLSCRCLRAMDRISSVNTGTDYAYQNDERAPVAILMKNPMDERSVCAA